MKRYLTIGLFAAALATTLPAQEKPAGAKSCGEESKGKG
jgi:hypothetical protein